MWWTIIVITLLYWPIPINMKVQTANDNHVLNWKYGTGSWILGVRIHRLMILLENPQFVQSVELYNLLAAEIW